LRALADWSFHGHEGGTSTGLVVGRWVFGTDIHTAYPQAGRACEEHGPDDRLAVSKGRGSGGSSRSCPWGQPYNPTLPGAGGLRSDAFEQPWPLRSSNAVRASHRGPNGA